MINVWEHDDQPTTELMMMIKSYFEVKFIYFFFLSSKKESRPPPPPPYNVKKKVKHNSKFHQSLPLPLSLYLFVVVINQQIDQRKNEFTKRARFCCCCCCWAHTCVFLSHCIDYQWSACATMILNTHSMHWKWNEQNKKTKKLIIQQANRQFFFCWMAMNKLRGRWTKWKFVLCATQCKEGEREWNYNADWKLCLDFFFLANQKNSASSSSSFAPFFSLFL